MGTTMRPRRRDPNTRFVARIPEQALHERVLNLAAPLLEHLGPNPPLEDVRDAVELAVTFWNAKARASQIWGTPKPRQLNDLQRSMTGKQASAKDADAFAELSQRWRDQELAFDPRLVGEWFLEVGEAGEPRLSCKMQLPDGVEAAVSPPVEKRVAIGGKFLDEAQIPLGGTPGTISLLSFPLQHHRGAVRDDGSVTVHTKMPTAVALLAEGTLPPIGGPSVELMIEGKKLEAMVFSELRCDRNGGLDDVAVLVFRPAPAAVVSR